MTKVAEGIAESDLQRLALAKGQSACHVSMQQEQIRLLEAVLENFPGESRCSTAR